MSLEAPQKPTSTNGLEPPHQSTPATSATGADAVDASKSAATGPEVPSSLNSNAKDAKDVKDAPNSASANGEAVAAAQPLETAKPKEPIEPTTTIQPELPKGISEATAATTEAKNNGVSIAQDNTVDKDAQTSEKMEVDSSQPNLPASDPTTLGNVPAKDSTGQDVDQPRAKDLATVQENAKHGHDDDQPATEEQPPAKKQKREPIKESNGADAAEAVDSPKRSMSRKKKEPKKATTEDGQPRRSSRLAS